MKERKFYRTDEFIKLQSEWYDKLKKSGFTDLEFYNPKTGAGHDGPFLTAPSSRSPAEIRRDYKPGIENHYRLCQTFLACGAFLRQKRRKNDKKVRNISLSYQKYENPELSTDKIAAEDDRAYKYTYLEYILWSLYCSGLSIRSISKEMRIRYSNGDFHLDCPSHARRPSLKPLSRFFISTRLKYLKAEMVEFNLNHPDGINVWDDEADEDWRSRPSSIYGSATPVDWKKR